MYQLSILKDVIPLHPETFHLPPSQALLNQLNKKYADRVIPDVGLGICVFDLLEASEGKVRYGDGCFWHKVTFRLVVFRPFVSEIIVGTVKECTEEYVRITTGFFDDIVVPQSQLPFPNAFDPNEKTHFWLASGADEHVDLLDSDVDTRLYIDRGETVRIRVEYDEFHDDEPGRPMASDSTAPVRTRSAPYEITASMAGAGLGLIVWWNADQASTEDPS